MKKLLASVLFLLLAVPATWADTQETTVFRAAMSPDNEVPVVSAPGNSGLAVITVRVTRDLTGNINAASVIFDIDYTVPGPTTFTGLHIHNSLPGTSGAVVINTGLSGTNTILANGTGHITRVVNYASTDTDGLKYVAGLLETPDNYYVNIHSTVQGSGLMRAPMPRTQLTLRPAMSALQEVPSLPAVDAEGAAALQILVNRNNAGAITSGSVSFDVDYRLPAGSVITGLHIHNAATGVNGPVVIDSGVNDSSRSIDTSVTGPRGNIFRMADIDSSNTAGLATLTALMADPTAFYVNLHTTANPSGIMRGQLSRDTFSFYGQMTQAEEVPATGSSGVANSLTSIQVLRDSTGNIVSGTVSFNVAHSGFGAAQTFTGLHIHNQIFGVNGSVVINTGLSGTNPRISPDGNGSINIPVTVDGTNAATLNAMKGVLANPENYYVNIHTTDFPGGIIRSQLAREVYHYRTLMDPANEVPPVPSATSATGWVTVRVNRDPATTAIVGGQVTFDVDAVGANVETTYTGLHIHTGPAGVNGAVVINTGLNGTTGAVVSATGTQNITRVVAVDPLAAPQVAMLNTLVNNPDQAYINLHTTVFSGGLERSQMLPVVNYIPQIAGGGEWISSITLTNPSTTSSVNGILDSFQSNGSAFSSALVDPNMSFLIPPGGSTTFNLHNKGTLTSGFTRVYSSGTVTSVAAYNFPTFASTASMTPLSARMATLPVSVSPSQNTGIAIYCQTAGQLVLSLTNSNLDLGAGGGRIIDVTAGQHLVGFLTELLPATSSTILTGTLVVEMRPTSGTGAFTAIALQFGGTLAPVAITPVP